MTQSEGCTQWSVSHLIRTREARSLKLLLYCLFASVTMSEITGKDSRKNLKNLTSLYISGIWVK